MAGENVSQADKKIIDGILSGKTVRVIAKELSLSRATCERRIAKLRQLNLIADELRGRPRNATNRPDLEHKRDVYWNDKFLALSTTDPDVTASIYTILSSYPVHQRAIIRMYFLKPVIRPEKLDHYAPGLASRRVAHLDRMRDTVSYEQRLEYRHLASFGAKAETIKHFFAIYAQFALQRKSLLKNKSEAKHAINADPLLGLVDETLSGGLESEAVRSVQDIYNNVYKAVNDILTEVILQADGIIMGDSVRFTNYESYNRMWEDIAAEAEAWAREAAVSEDNVAKKRPIEEQSLKAGEIARSIKTDTDAHTETVVVDEIFEEGAFIYQNTVNKDFGYNIYK